MLALLAIYAATTQVHAESAAAFLRTMQQPSGGFISDQLQPGETARPTLRTTRTALRSFRLLGVEVPNRDRVIAFHAGCYNEATGGFSETPGGSPDPISTSVGLMILRELKLPSDAYLERGLRFMNDHTRSFEQMRMVASSLEEYGVTIPNAKVWASQLLAEANDDGSFGTGPGQARITGLYGVAIQRLGGQIDRRGVLRAMRAGQRPDGGFGSDTPGGSDLESCYRIVRLFHRLGAKPDRVEDLRTFIASCRNDDGGYGRTPQQASSLHGTYYATIVTSWLDDLDKKSDASARWTFDDDPLGGLPAGWKPANTSQPPTTHWQIEAADGGRVLTQTATDGLSKQYNLCVSDHRCRNADITVRVRARTGKIDQGGGPVWRYTDPRNYYIARWNPLEDNLRVYKVVDGVRTQLDTATVPHTGGWQTLRIVTYGRDIRGYLNGHLLLEAEDDQFPNPGLIGLWTKADAVTQFDDLSVAPATAEDLESMPIPQIP